MQLEEYRKDKDFNGLEEILSNLDLNKRQFDVIIESFIPKYSKVKKDLRKGIHNLIKARRLIFTSLFCWDSLNKLLKSTEVLTNSQLWNMNSLTLWPKIKSIYSISNTFGIRKEEKLLPFIYQLKEILPKRKYEASNEKEWMFKYTLNDVEMEDLN